MGTSSTSNTQTSSTQNYLLSGPTAQAASEAAGVETQAANMASQYVTNNSNQALNSLIGSYNTSTGLQSTEINSANQAENQMNYMLGLPSVSNTQVGPNTKATPGANASQMANVIDNLPGFQMQQQQGINAIQNAASASGALNSGNTLEALDQFGQGLAGTYQTNYMNQLGSVASLGQGAISQAATAANNLGTQEAAQYNTQGTAQANAALAGGQAQAQGILSTPTNQEVTATPYTNTTSSSTGSFTGMSF